MTAKLKDEKQTHKLCRRVITNGQGILKTDFDNGRVASMRSSQVSRNSGQIKRNVQKKHRMSRIAMMVSQIT